MNPAIAGALIGAVPGTLAAALATWASIQSSKTNLQQTKLTLVGDHSRWMREKRADSYIEMMAYLRENGIQRLQMLRARPEVDLAREVIENQFEYNHSLGYTERFSNAAAYVSETADECIRDG